MALIISPAIALFAGNTVGQPAVSKVELQSLPAATPNPALIGLNALRIGVFSQFPQPDIVLADINARAGKRLADADPRLAALLREGIITAPLANSPFIRINIDSFFLTTDRPPVFRVQTTLSADVPAGITLSSFLNVDLWSRIDTIQAPNANSELAAVNSLINKHIEQFAADFSIANATSSQPADVNYITTPKTPQKSAESKKPAAAERSAATQEKTQNAPTQFSFVGSKNSKVFHKPDCPSVKDILPQNLVYYKTRDEAIAAGKRPCLRCKP